MSNNDFGKAQAITPDQLKAARALLGWTRLQLALRSATSEHIVSRYEKTGHVAGQYGQPELGDPIAAICATFEAAGVEFTTECMPGSAPAKAEPMTPDQMKAARVLLGWSMDRLSARSGTSYHMVQTFERTGRVRAIQRRRDLTDPLAAVRVTLEAAGVVFTNGDEPGVKLLKPNP